MPSRKQMELLDAQFRTLQGQNRRQKEALDRLTAAHIEMSASLFEIATGDLSESQAQNRAQKALDTVAAMIGVREDAAPTSGNSEDEGD